MRRLASLWICAALLACAGAPILRDSTKSGVYGYLKLVPHEGARPPKTAGAPTGAYADRRIADAELVDYTRPGFAIVYLDGDDVAAPAPLALTIRSGAAGVRFDPPHGAVAAGSELVVRNGDGAPHVVSVPAAGVLRSLAPGEQLAVPTASAGEIELFLPGAAGAEARVFAAPGPFAAVNDAGRFELLDVAPGERRLHAWHPRFPPAERTVQLGAGRVLRADLEIGVGLGGSADGR